MTRSIGGGLFLALSLAAGCQGSGGDSTSAAATSAKPGATAVSTAKPSGVMPTGDAPAAASSSATTTTAGASTATSAESAAGTSPGAGLSAVPTKAEWDAAREVTVNGSSTIGCETKAVREYLRVSCSGNSTGGTPSALTITKGGGRPGMFTFVADGVTSLIVPFLEGVDLTADFAWSNGTHYTLTVEWPRGAPKPTRYGVFGNYRRTP